MQRILIHSSNIQSIGYEREAGTLEVEFTSGEIYQYFHVPEVVHSDLLHAASHGEYLNGHIRYNYRYQKVR